MNSKEIKPKACAICSGEFIPFSTTARVCSPTCAIEWNRQKDIKKAKKKHVARKKVFYASDIKLRKRVAQEYFNRFIRVRDINKGCISCDKTELWKGQWHAGHFKTVGARSDLRFNEDNCHKQCSPCNNHLSGNIAEYTPRLIERIGIKRFDALTLVINKKYTCDDYLQIEEEYKSKIKALNAKRTT